MRTVRTYPLAELKIAGDSGPGSFEGRASTFGSLDSYGDIVDPGAYKDSLPDFLTRGFISWGHDWSTPIALVTKAEERDDGLWVAGRFHTTTAAQEARIIAKERVDAGHFMGLSIGYEPEAWEIRPSDEPIRNRWGEYTDKIRALTKIKLYEVSLVTVPAEPMAGVSTVKGEGIAFEVHCEQVEAALVEWLERCKAPIKAGRAVSEARRIRIQAVSGSLRSAADELDDLVSEGDDEEGKGRKSAGKAAIPYATHGTADEATSWTRPSLGDFTDEMWGDLSDSEKRRIANHFVWSESGNPPENFGDLGGGHHEPGTSGVGAAVWLAVSSGRMAQADWFTDAGVRRHLAAHYREFDRTPPWEEDAVNPDELKQIHERFLARGAFYGLKVEGEGD